MLIKRYRQIVFFFARILISLALWDIVLPHLGLGKWSARNRERRLEKVAAQFRALAIKMGGVMIKVGQFLSTRVDVLPAVITRELSGLQDEVPPENFEDIRQVAEEEYGMGLDQKFAYFDPKPLAAASLGQVHRAQLHLVGEEEGQGQLVDVVVKIQRPLIEKIIATDMAALRTVGNWLRLYRPISKRADVPALIAEFSRVLYEEIDYLAEGANAETFDKNFQNVPGVRVPRVIWSHTTKRALTLEDVTGIKITDYAAIRAAGIDADEVATRLLDTYLKQIFEDGFFHADPHPGNLFVYPLEEKEGRKEWLLTFVDFGMVGRIPTNTRQGLREMLVAVGTKDAARVVHSYQMLGVLLPSADVKLLERAEERLFDRFWGKSMNELFEISPREIAQLALEFRQLLYELPFQVPIDLIFLGRTVGILSGMCTGLNPEFNVWNHLAPFAQKLIAEEAIGAGGFWLKELGVLAQKLFKLPQRTEALLDRVERGELVVRDLQLVEQVKQLEIAVLRAGIAIVFAALLVGGVQLYLGGNQLLAECFWLGATLALFWMIFSRRKKKS